MIKVRDDLKYLASHLSNRATYSDAMYELYVRMKVAQGRKDIKEGKISPHNKVRQRFQK